MSLFGVGYLDAGFRPQQSQYRTDHTIRPRQRELPSRRPPGSASAQTHARPAVVRRRVPNVAKILEFEETSLSDSGCSQMFRYYYNNNNR